MCVSGKTGGADAVRDAEDRIERLRDWPQDSRAAPEEEDGPRRTRAAHGSVAGASLEDRARAVVSHAADASPDRAGLWRGPRVLLRWRAREAAPRRRAEGGARATSGSARRARRLVPVRIARLFGNRAAVQLVLRGLPAGVAREAPRPPARRCRVHLRAAGRARRARRRGRTHIGSRRRDVFRFHRSTWLPESWSRGVQRDRRDRRLTPSAGQ